jgi:hypothetical protein
MERGRPGRSSSYNPGRRRSIKASPLPNCGFGPLETACDLRIVGAFRRPEHDFSAGDDGVGQPTGSSETGHPNALLFAQKIGGLALGAKAPSFGWERAWCIISEKDFVAPTGADQKILSLARHSAIQSGVAMARFHFLLRGTWVFVLASGGGLVCAQRPEASPATLARSDTRSAAGVPASPQDKIDKRAFGIFPNYRSADASAPFQPISNREKMAIAVKDSFDWPIFFITAGYAGLGQITNQNPPFGQGIKGYANRYVRIYTDLAMGNLLTEGLMPSFLHEDPRYFRCGTGTLWKRTGYATSRIFLTRTNGGGTRFNFSEVAGNSIAAGISNAYYPDTRTVRHNFEKLTVQLAMDAVSNVMKEFWPDVKRGLLRWHQTNRVTTPFCSRNYCGGKWNSPP